MSILTQKRNLVEELQSAFSRYGLDKDAFRKKALDRFLKKGFPTAKTEEYKFTPITRELEKVASFTRTETNADSFTPASIPVLANLACNLLAFVNGKYAADKSVILDADLRIQVAQTAEGNEDNDPFDLLNQAFSTELIRISVAGKKTIKHPLVVVYYFDSTEFVFAHPRWECQLGAQSELSIIEYFYTVGEATHFNNKHSVIEVAENAHLEYTVIQNGPREIQVNNSTVRLADHATASSFTYTFEGQLVRNNLTVVVDGQGIDAHLHGLYLLANKTIADNHTVVDHRQPNSNSNELYKGVMDGNSKGVFNGKIYVRPHAQKTNAFQSNRNILLSERATVNTKPQLEIWADDVKCSHGCTTGQLDEEALFYLRSRGISKEMARGMMLYAFAAETLGSMKNETVRNFVDTLIAEKLQKNF